jgi:hypothetical protein
MPSIYPDPASISIETATGMIEELVALEPIDILPLKKAISLLDDEELAKLTGYLKQLTIQVQHVKYRRTDKAVKTKVKNAAARLPRTRDRKKKAPVVPVFTDK